MRAVLNREVLQTPPVSIRLDLWYQDAKSAGTLPASLKSLSSVEVEDHLGFCRAARHRAGPRLVFPEVGPATRVQGDDTVEAYSFGGKTLSRRTVRTAEQKRQGLRGHIADYPISTESDLDLFLEAAPSVRIELDADGFADLDAATGEAGLPIFIAGLSAPHRVMLEFMGYETFYYLMTDCPDKLDAFIAGLQAAYARDLWPALASSPAEVILYGSHFSTATTPPPIFERYFVPELRQMCDHLHAAGKKVFWHADAEMGALLKYVLDCGYDGADCLATSPLVSQSLQDCFEAWEGRITCWGGLPSIVFDPNYPLADYRRHLEDLMVLTRGRNDFIFGASDNVMPGAAWERLELLAEMTGTRN